jgi:hypothetical protein
MVVEGVENPLNYHTIRTTKTPKKPYNQDYDNSLNYHTIRTTTTP